MTRFLIGLASGFAAGAITSYLAAVEPWWLAASSIAVVLVLLGRWGVGLIDTALNHRR